MIDREALRVGMMQVALRILTERAGGLIVISKADYIDSVDETKHFHMEKTGDEMRFMSIPEDECTMDEEEQSPSTPIFSPTGGRIQ